LLGDVIEGSGSECVEGIVGILLGRRTDHDDRAREPTHDATQGLQPVEAGHFHVEGDDLGIERGNFVERIRSAACCGGNFETGFGSDHLRESSTHECAVVDYEYADRRTRCGFPGHVR
jgi:hypothetical protein